MAENIKYSCRPYGWALVLSFIATISFHISDSIKISDIRLKTSQGCQASGWYSNVEVPINQLSPGANYIDRISQVSNVANSQGAFHIHTTIGINKAEFHARIVGPIVQVVYFKYQDGNTFCGEYDLSVPGNFFLEIVLLTADFNENDIMNGNFLNCTPPVVSEYMFEVTEVIPRPPQHGKCNPVDAKGTWHVKDASLLNYLQRTRMWGYDAWPVDHAAIHARSPDEGDQLIYALSSNCQSNFIHNYTMALDCLASSNQKVCMWGDSHMLYLYLSIMSLINRTTTPVVDIYEEISRGPENLSYYFKTYEGFYQDIEGLIKNGTCTMILANFGQWPASYLEDYPWPLTKYKTYAEADIAYLSTLQANSSHKVFWVTVNPGGFLPKMLQNIEWRSDPVIDRYNVIARELALRYRLPVLDVHAIVRPLSDLGFDISNGHSHFKGSVGWAMAQYVLNNICPDILPRRYP